LEEHYADEADKVISVFHFSKEVQRTHGVPFKFVVKPVSSRLLKREGNRLNPNQGERFADTKKRLQARIGASDKDFARFRFALIQAVTFKQPSYIEDGEFITPECFK
jgi:ubiquitin carboxyl-terminal hydrolase 7